MAYLGIDLNQVEAQETFEPLPAGEYVAVVEDSEMKQAKSGGTYLSCRFRVIAGQYNNRTIFANFNIGNHSEQARSIALKQLKQLTTACGRPVIQDSQEIHNIPVIVIVSIKDDPSYGPRNEVKGYKSTGIQAPAAAPARPSAPARPAAAPARPAAQAAQTPPWRQAAAVVAPVETDDIPF